MDEYSCALYSKLLPFKEDWMRMGLVASAQTHLTPALLEGEGV
jgi:hypothetical protein